MLFNSASFFIFFPIVILVYFLLPRKIKNLWLLVASYFFYMCWNAKYALLLLTSTTITYFSGIFIARVRKKGYAKEKEIYLKKWCVFVSFSLNLSILFFFKYFTMSVTILNKVLSLIGIENIQPGFSVLLPVGISFYIFQALSYTMDVYREEIEPEKNFFEYALFVSFFPQLVAGPIERSKNLLIQFKEVHKFKFENMRDGLLIMLWGYFLKLVIADRIAVIVDRVYGEIQTYQGMYLIVATLLFAIQLYCDFYGYSTIALGVAKIMGFQLTDNFEAPYMSRSMKEFWRKWHISLSFWFKDYLYIPLGGSRKGRVRKYLNLMIVFLTSGLWHGASISFVVWGGLNGLYQIVGEVLTPVRNFLVNKFHLNRKSFSHNLYRIVGTFLLYDFSLIFFRSTGVKEAVKVIKSMWMVKNPWILFDGSLYELGLDQKNFTLLLVCIIFLVVADYLKSKKIVIRDFIWKQELWFQYVYLIMAILFVFFTGIWGPEYSETAFLYFQF